MMNYTDSFDEDDYCSVELPPMRPCSTATANPSIKQRGRAVKAAFGRFVFEDDDNRTVISNAKSLGGYGADSSCISLGENTVVNRPCSYASDDETICSSNLYSLHNYSHHMRKDKRQKNQATTERNIATSLFCSLDDILEDDFFKDFQASCKQVLYAFVISPEDIDGVADTIHGARDEIIEMEVERNLSKLQDLKSRR